MAYVHQDYPKIKYHPVHGDTVVETPDEDAELGEEWTETPADFGVVTAPSRQQLAEMARQPKGKK